MSRIEKLRPTCLQAYDRNLLVAKNPELFVKTVIGILPRILPCMRLHVSGDFWSVHYIESWIKICSSFPQTQFWTYTRSWIIPELLEPLNQLQTLANVELFASTDPSMPIPPLGWRIGFLDKDVRAKGLECPQQNGIINSCLKCGYCFRKEKGDVIFRVH
jgi:hypothetical protein